MSNIHERGRNALDAFESLPWPTGTRRFRGPAAGRSAKTIPDFRVEYIEPSVCVPVEVKTSTTSTAQLRPLSYHTTVVWREGVGWWVIPPHDILVLALDYNGQHCTNSFECFNPGK